MAFLNRNLSEGSGCARAGPTRTHGVLAPVIMAVALMMWNPKTGDVCTYIFPRDTWLLYLPEVPIGFTVWDLNVKRVQTPRGCKPLYDAADEDAQLNEQWVDPEEYTRMTMTRGARVVLITDEEWA